MTRSAVDAAYEAVLSSGATTPHMLVVVELPGGELRFTDNEPVTIEHTGGPLGGSGTVSYVTGVTVSGLEATRGGGATATIKFPNTDAAVSPLFIAVGFIGHRVTISAYYPGQDAVPFITGETDGGSWSDDSVSVRVKFRAGMRGKLPRLVIGPPMLNWLPQPGEITHWNGQEYEAPG